MAKNQNRIRNRWELITCGLGGHVTYAPDDAALAARLRASTGLGEVWRCLRCGDFALGGPQGRGAPEDAPLIMRGKALRQAIIIRALGVERLVRALVLALAAWAVWEFRGARGAAAGMGKVNTGLTATLLADRFGCRTIVFTGVAGGLDPELCIGDIVIADRVVQHDFGLLTDERLRPYQPGHIPFIEPTERLGYPVDPAVIDRVKHRLDGFTLAPLSTAAGGGGRQPRIYYGTILTGDQYLHCERTRNRLHHELGGMAVEMEGGAVAQICASFDIPWLVIRALSDLAGADSGVDFNRFVGEVAASSARVLLRLLPVLTAC